MKIRLSMQGVSLNVEVSDEKAMGIYHRLAERLLLQTGVPEPRPAEKGEGPKEPPAKIVLEDVNMKDEPKEQVPFSPLIRTMEGCRLNFQNAMSELVTPLRK